MASGARRQILILSFAGNAEAIALLVKAEEARASGAKYQAHRALALQLCNVDISGAVLVTVLAQGGCRHPSIRHRHRFAAQSCHQESP